MSTVARKSYLRGFLLVVLGFVLAVLLGLLLGRVVDSRPTASANGTGTGTGDGPGGAEVAGSTRSFSIYGNAANPISPGVRAPLDLALTNPQDVPMSVTGLSVRVQKVSAPNADDAHPCVVGDFTVEQASSGITITVAARATSTLSGLGLPRATWPQVGMLDRSVNQDGCKGASLTLGYTATGTLAQ
ncbi:MAG: hypothetical protein ACYDC9_01650 [Dermatophilaceae bacterium]